ncbi:SDR family oxidoreductase [Bacillus sp. RD4P76]|uniref:SDR family oxidoreductase n=1 Tax=Bacillus suaedaesalsae TaxID=2810349 RepID=A0ABS2DG05_9BACI|nr:SDR family oxidoreductase [Bacillus suaedaesalsae]MBM6616466.1 SDR family oxidoreductase [Bacillus suaedaesalsae]
MNSIVITGGGTGLGRELSLQYSSSIDHIILLGRTEAPLMETKELIENRGNKATYFICDLQNLESIKTTVEKIIANYSVYTLINNTGIGTFGPYEEMDDESIYQMINTNVLGTIFITKYLLPHLKQKPNAKIINIISTAGLRGKVNEVVYCSSKFAVRGFTESLQKEVEANKVTVTGVYMGGMNTPFWDHSTHIEDKSRLKAPAEVAKQIKEQDDGKLEIIIS